MKHSDSNQVESRVSRRRFLKMAGAGALATLSASALSACGIGRAQPTVFPTATPLPPITPTTGSAELALINGHVITVDARGTIAQAVAVQSGRIVAVGSNQDIEELIGPQTRVLDLAGQTVTPGLIDSHNHFQGFGVVQQLLVDLRPPKVSTITAIQQRIAEQVAQTPAGTWVIGHGFYTLDDGRWPNRHDLDPVSPNNPVFILHGSGQFGVANSRALQEAEITRSTRNPPGGVIQKDEQGEPTGVMLMYPAEVEVLKSFPLYPVEELEKCIQWAEDQFLAQGITSIQDVMVSGQVISPLQAIEAYQSLAERGELRIRVDMMPYLNNMDRLEKALRTYPSLEVGRLKLEGWKISVDGGLLGRSCLTYEPFAEGSTGIALHSEKELNDMVRLCHEAGHQVSMHVVGDKAIDWGLNAIEKALEKAPRENHRHRLEHAALPTGEALERMRKLGVVVSTQPTYVFYGPADLYVEWWGMDRAAKAAPIQTWRKMGIPVAFGADPPANHEWLPQLTLWAAVTRQSQSGAVIGPEEAVTIQEALYMHTMGSAYAAFEENVKGSIEPGKLADMAIWEEDLYSVPAEHIKEVKVQTTIIDGEVVYQAEGADFGPGAVIGG